MRSSTLEKARKICVATIFASAAVFVGGATKLFFDDAKPAHSASAITPDQFCNEMVESSKQLNDFVAKYEKDSSVILTRENCMAEMNKKPATALTP